MNKTQIIGLIMLIIAVAIPFVFNNDTTDFLVGFFGGGGLALNYGNSP